LGAALTDKDVAGEDLLAAKLLHAEALRLGVATVARRTASFLVCHRITPSFLELYSLSAAAVSWSTLARGALPARSSLACSTHSSRPIRPPRLSSSSSLAISAFFSLAMDISVP